MDFNRHEHSVMPHTSGHKPSMQRELAYLRASVLTVCSVSRIFESEGVKNRKQRPNHLTPPYVTAQPEVTHRRLSSDNDRIRFIIMATDGCRFWC